MIKNYDIVLVLSLEKKGMVISTAYDLALGKKRFVCMVDENRNIITDEEDLRFLSDAEDALRDALEYYHGREA